MGQPSPNDHAGWSPPPGPGPWSGTTPMTCPGRPAGAGEHLLHPGLPHHPAGTRPGPAPCRSGGQATPQPGRQPSGSPGRGSTLVRASTANAAPSLAVRPDAGRRPRRPRTTAARRPTAPNPRAARRTEPLQVQRGADSAAVAPRTPESCPSGHLIAADAWTPDAWTSDVRSTGWTDVPTTGLGMRTGQRPAWPTSRHPRDRQPPAGRPDLTRSRRLGALGHPGRL
jgi:hypothetical protein